VTGMENFRPGETYCIAANHTSTLDAFVMAMVGERGFRCIIKKSLVFYPVVGEQRAAALAHR